MGQIPAEEGTQKPYSHQYVPELIGRNDYKESGLQYVFLQRSTDRLHALQVHIK